MAVYYRWRRRSVTITEKHSGSYSEITPDSSSTTLYYSNYIDLKSDYPNVSLVSPQRTTLKDGTLEQCGTWRNYMYFLNGASSGPCVYYGQGDGVYWNSKNSRFDLINGSSSADNLFIITSSISYGDDVNYVYSTNSSAYPNGGVSGNYYYDQRTTVTSPTAPTGLTYPNPITTPTVTVSWQAATSNVPGVTVSYYQVAYRVNPPYEAMPEWHSENITGTSYQLQIPTGITQIKIWVYAYDSNGNYANASNGYVSVYFAPTLTVPQMVMQGQQATVSWTAIDGADSYTLQRKANTDSDWVQVYSGADTTFTETAGTWTTVQYRVQAVFDGTGGGWAESNSIPVISASALVISGSDSDLGTLVNDVQYTINTDTGNQITAKVTVNSAVVFSGNVTSGAASTISIFDLVNGTGTIVIEASVQASSGVVNATRTWTYTKAELTFPDTGSIAQLLQKGKNIFPKTLAECVRLPGDRTLDEITGFPCQMYVGSYVGTGTYGVDNPTILMAPFKPKAAFVSMYQAPGYGMAFLISSDSHATVINNSSTLAASVMWEDNSVAFYANSAFGQLNLSGAACYYVIFG